MLNRIMCRHNRLHRLQKRILLSVGTLLSLSGFGLAEEARIEIRKRTDPNVEADIRAVRELQSKHLESKPPLGLSELAAQPSNTSPQATAGVVPATLASSLPRYESAPVNPRIIIGPATRQLWERVTKWRSKIWKLSKDQSFCPVMINTN